MSKLFNLLFILFTLNRLEHLILRIKCVSISFNYRHVKVLCLDVVRYVCVGTIAIHRKSLYNDNRSSDRHHHRHHLTCISCHCLLELSVYQTNNFDLCLFMCLYSAVSILLKHELCKQTKSTVKAKCHAFNSIRGCQALFVSECCLMIKRYRVSKSKCTFAFLPFEEHHTQSHL